MSFGIFTLQSVGKINTSTASLKIAAMLLLNALKLQL